MGISSAVLCVTSAIVAIQIGRANQDNSPAQAGWAGAWRWAAIIASAVILLYALVKASSNPITVDSTATVTATNTLTVAAPTQTVVPSPGTAAGNAVNPLPDADSQGFMTYQGGARCHGGDPAAPIVRTPESAAVICQSGSAAFYYRGLRLSDGANIELAGATQTGQLLTVTNPAMARNTN